MSEPRPDRETFVVELEAVADPLVKTRGTAAGRDPAYRLRLALKHFARSYGLKCMAIAPGPRPLSRRRAGRPDCSPRRKSERPATYILAQTAQTGRAG